MISQAHSKSWHCWQSVAYSTKEANQSLAKLPLNSYGSLAKLGLTDTYMARVSSALWTWWYGKGSHEFSSSLNEAVVCLLLRLTVNSRMWTLDLTTYISGDRPALRSPREVFTWEINPCSLLHFKQYNVISTISFHFRLQKEKYWLNRHAY